MEFVSEAFDWIKSHPLPSVLVGGGIIGVLWFTSSKGGSSGATVTGTTSPYTVVPLTGSTTGGTATNPGSNSGGLTSAPSTTGSGASGTGTVVSPITTSTPNGGTTKAPKPTVIAPVTPHPIVAKLEKAAPKSAAAKSVIVAPPTPVQTGTPIPVTEQGAIGVSNSGYYGEPVGYSQGATPKQNALAEQLYAAPAGGAEYHKLLAEYNKAIGVG